MPTDLELAITTGPLADTHEHQFNTANWAASPPDPLTDICDGYVANDLNSAGAGPQADDAIWAEGQDLEARWRQLEPWWESIELTGYGQAARHTARLCYGLEEITAEGLVSVVPQAVAWRQPGGRDRLFREVAGLSTVQIDSFTWHVDLDPEDPSYYRYDLGFADSASGRPDLAELLAMTGVEVRTPDDLRAAFGALFGQKVAAAVALKSQHAYQRTLAWQDRSDDDVAPLVARHASNEALSEAERLALGDWCLARAAELCAEHGLPFKIHTGHLAGNGNSRQESIRPSQLASLFAAQPQTRFVLMHAGWPYGAELVALGKHFANVWGDCCWAWSMSPRATEAFVRDWLHAAPANKLLVFGGDTGRPTKTVGYAHQARAGLTRALSAEVAEGTLTEAAAIQLAERLMNGNAEALFGPG